MWDALYLQSHPCGLTTGRGTGQFFSSFFLIHMSHSISFTRAQGIPKYKIGFGREKDGKVGERLVEGGGGHGARDVGCQWGEQPSLAVMLATGQFKNCRRLEARIIRLLCLGFACEYVQVRC